MHGSLRFYTCARPGRSKKKSGAVADKIVRKWVNGLPEPNTAIVSLLGSKPDGMSEFTFYSFRSEFDPMRGSRLSFQEWLDRFHPERSILVVEHPTIDFASEIPSDKFAAIVADVARLAGEGRTVILVDSGGEQRSGEVCRRMGAKEDFSRDGS